LSATCLKRFSGKYLSFSLQPATARWVVIGSTQVSPISSTFGLIGSPAV
jgi:hypothetical protein